MQLKVISYESLSAIASFLPFVLSTENPDQLERMKNQFVNFDQVTLSRSTILFFSHCCAHTFTSLPLSFSFWTAPVQNYCAHIV